MSRVLFLIQVSRPIVWFFLPMVYYLGLNAAGAEVTPAAAAQMLLLTFPMNLIGCGLNDIYDYESDRICKRRSSIWGVAVGEKDQPLVWRASLAMMPLVLAGGVASASVVNLAATTGLLLLAWAYSVPPVRLKERPPLDSLANGLGYFLLPLVMGYSLGADPRGMPLKYYLLALSVCGVHALATAADYNADREAGHRTLAVVYGRRTAASVAFAAFLVTWVASDFHGVAVRVFVAMCVLVTFVAALVPRDRPINVACCAIFVGFLIAAVCHVCGL